jgi:hypothetical protein
LSIVVAWKFFETVLEISTDIVEEVVRVFEIACSRIANAADPQKVVGPNGKSVAHYPALGETVAVSANTAAIKPSKTIW